MPAAARDVPKNFGTVVARVEVQLAPEVFVVEPTLMVIGLDHRLRRLPCGSASSSPKADDTKFCVT